MAYEVLTYTLCDGWINCWSISEGNEEPRPQTFETREAAQAELNEFLQDVKDAVAAGDMEEEYDPDDYMIQEVGARMEPEGPRVLIIEQF